MVMLMGCSSGRLLVRGQLEQSGMMTSYFLAGWYGAWLYYTSRDLLTL